LIPLVLFGTLIDDILPCPLKLRLPDKGWKNLKKVEKYRQKDYNRNAMKNTKTDIYQVNDSFFHKIFDTPENARDFMERVLPVGLKKQLDLSKIEIEDTKYVSNKFEKGFSDIVVKTSLKTKKGKKKLVDIYFIIEHKTEGRSEIFIQVLKYMVFEWEKDYNNNSPPRIIIPVKERLSIYVAGFNESGV